MSQSLTQLAVRAALITETINDFEDVTSDLQKAGLASEALERGRDLVVHVLEMLESLSAHPDDHTAHERATKNVFELNECVRAQRGVWERAFGDKLDKENWPEACGDELEGPDPHLTSLMRARRLLAAIRISDSITDVFRGRRQLSDELLRLRSLYIRTERQVHLAHHLRKGMERSGVNLEDQKKAMTELKAWLEAFEEAAVKAFADDADLLGFMGIVPAGKGIPLGGAAREVVLHREARGERPEPVPANPTPHWNRGAEGNRHNYW